MKRFVFYFASVFCSKPLTLKITVPNDLDYLIQSKYMVEN